MPDKDDDFLDIEYGYGEKQMSNGECSCQFDKAIEVTMARMIQNASHDSERLRGVNDFVSEQSQIGYLEEGKKVGTREAAAMQRMDQDRLSAMIAQLGSANRFSPIAGGS